jgi:hypothetical protein
MLGRAPRVATLLALAASITGGQEIVDTRKTNREKARHGTPVRVELSELLLDCTFYGERAIRTRGIRDSESLGSAYRLREPTGGGVRLIPEPNVRDRFNADARNWFGKEVHVTGLAGRIDTSKSSEAIAEMTPCFIRFWSYLGPPERQVKGGPLKAEEVTLEGLVSKPGKLDGKYVRVVGTFRGRNLFGDLPVGSERESSDWVIADDSFAVWVTGKPPKGSGWELNASLKSDTNQWIEVVGRPETAGGVTYIRALQVALSSPPRRAAAGAAAASPPPPPPKTKVPPVIAFSLPLEGERDVPSAGVLKVQFSKDMDAESFRDRVVVSYVGPRLPEGRAFMSIRVSYDEGQRTLIVDPGQPLHPGSVVEIRLLSGIVDVDGLPLVPRPGRELSAATADVLRFEVAP